MTTIRLATSNASSPMRTGSAFGAPAVRLAVSGMKKSDREAAMPLDVRLAYGGPPESIEAGLAPTVRLAHGAGAQGDNVLLGQRGVERLPEESRPALLVSYVYLEPFLKARHRYAYRDWVLDSGAFSAYNVGMTISLEDYIEKAKALKAEDPTLVEVYSLDVIGDWRGSLKNTEEMWKAGIEAIPCFHVNEPWDVLIGMARDYPKIALGGVALAKTGKKMQWAEQCFARVWPKKIHGFAFCSEKAVMGLPFHSVDSTSWEIGPTKFGNWRSFGQASVRGSRQNLRSEVEWYLRLERQARSRWANEMSLLEGR